MSQQLGKISGHLSPKSYTTKRVVSMTNKQQRTTSMRSTSSVTPSELENMMGVKEANESPEYREVTYGEIMKDYKPTSLAVYGFLASMIASL